MECPTKTTLMAIQVLGRVSLKRQDHLTRGLTCNALSAKAALVSRWMAASVVSLAACLTLAVSGRGERMRASGPLQRGVRKPVATGRHRTTPSHGGLARRARRVPCEASCPLSGWLPPPRSQVARRDRRASAGPRAFQPRAALGGAPLSARAR